MATDVFLARQITADEIDFDNATGVDVSLSGTIYVENGGKIGDFIIEDGELYAGASKRSDNSITIGTDTSSGLTGKIDIRGPSGGTTNNLLYIQGGGIQHQLGEFLADDVRLRGKTKFPTGATIDISTGVNYSGVFSGATSGRRTTIRTSSTSINLETITSPYYGIDLDYIVHTGSSNSIIYLPTTAAGGKVVGKEYRIMREQGITLTVSTNNASTYIKYGADSTAISVDLANARDEYTFMWDGSFWQYHWISRG
jgi:hypothetical protein